jgi:hypothetical protein
LCHEMKLLNDKKHLNYLINIKKIISQHFPHLL